MPVRTPKAKLYLDGYPSKILDTAGAINISYSVGQPIASGTIQIIDPPVEPKWKTAVTVVWGYGTDLVYGYTGFITNPGQQSYPKRWNCAVQDVLWLADFPIQDEINLLNNKTARETLIILLRDWSGIQEERLLIPELESSPGTPWLLGQLTPILFRGMSPLQAALQIVTPLGLWLYADAGGFVRVIDVSGAPLENYAHLYAAGDNLFVSGAPTVNRAVDQVYNQVIVTGANTGFGGAQIKDSWRVDIPHLLPHGKDRVLPYSNGLIEYTSLENGGATSCEGVAQRMVREHGRDPFTVSIAGAAAEPRKVFAGQTVALQDARIGLTTPRTFFVMSFTRTFGGGQFRDTGITLDGGLGPEGYTTQPDPVPAFTYKLIKETLEGVDYIELFLDGSVSYAFGGQEVITWVWSDNYVPQNTATGKYAVFIYPDDPGLTSVQITLTVTDTLGKSATIQQYISLVTGPQGPANSRVLNVAAGNGWYVTPDGGKRWNKASGQATIAVPPISGLGSVESDVPTATEVGLLATGGASGQTIRQTIDNLATAPTTLATLPGPANFLWQHERDARRVWAAVGDRLYLSLDGGVTFAAKGVPNAGNNINWVTEAFDNIGTLDVLAGRNVYTSYDEGNNFGEPLSDGSYLETLEGPAGSTARCYASGHEKHWIGFTGVTAPSSPLRSVEGDIAAFPSVTPEVTEIRALTMMVEEPIMFALDGQGRIWKFEVTAGNDGEHVNTLPDA